MPISPKSARINVLRKDKRTMKLHKAKIDARLRRLCEVKAKGKLQVPEWLHKKWVNDKESLAKTFEECGLDKDRI